MGSEPQPYNGVSDYSKPTRKAAARVCGNKEMTEGLPRACHTLKHKSAPPAKLMILSPPPANQTAMKRSC